MEFQVITTDMAEAEKYGVSNAKKGLKWSEMLRSEREKLFKQRKPLKVKEVTEKKKRETAPKSTKIKRNWGPLTKYGRKARPGEYRLPNYARVTCNRFIKHTPEHDKRADDVIGMVTREFAEVFGFHEASIRSNDKGYEVTRIRNMTIGFLHAHGHFDSEDIKRNFDIKADYTGREHYRRCLVLLERAYFARGYSQIYKKLKRNKVIDYDFRTDGLHIAVNRSFVEYSRRSGRDYKLRKSSKACKMV